MARRQRIRYELNTGEITKLQPDEIRVILRAADEMIATAGRSMLVKVLKGSKDKKVLEYKLDECPSYGYYHDLTMEEIEKRVDYMIVKRYLRIEYSDHLPMLYLQIRAGKLNAKRIQVNGFAVLRRLLNRRCCVWICLRS